MFVGCYCNHSGHSSISFALPSRIGYCIPASILFRSFRLFRPHRKWNLYCSLKRAERYSSSDWSRCLLSLPKSVILSRIQSHLFWTSCVSFIVSLFDHFFKIPPFSPIPHTLLGSAMGLLLVFRTNSAYDRFWEARKLVGVLAVQSREMTRCIHSYFDEEKYQVIKNRLIMLLKLFLVGFLQHVQGTTDVASFRKIIRSNPEYSESSHTVDIFADEIVHSPNPPLFVLFQLSMQVKAVFKNADISYCVVQRAKMEWQLSSLMEVLSGCERIITTPVPLGYSRHTSRFLSLWCFTFPLLIVSHLKFLTVPVTAFVCWSLFGIEEIGHVIEDPFLEGVEKLPIKSMISSLLADIDYLSHLSVYEK
ncbi:hypothetical protein GpartN1_g1058.t1 [Galdieria partita]|uniref:Uncharacterized protein n=1 Tax=Galdieria partita TaxID=83374 RepID=A0A9C7PT87_9RHOD|nr:hypothetical protein GpartN1_g1058.t1 [Galdieria partita]